ncbi:lipopolysaccharide biosynthesis protein [Lunatimonas salinarum]|uniref:lipopolysaccharide biosynthesis protein n=1 Tax=Lunatimonas salinarum TaxID=1774590 RepID=UPI001ADF395B|nr:oligosaccharide flippase family protein [Lunatimonas salinarum]
MKVMFSRLYNQLKGFLNKGHERSIKAKKNILASFLIKGGSIAVSLVLVPMTLNYVDDTRYGIWLTLSSLVGWFSFFDIGFGHGLRNKFAESVAQGKFTLARSYISTTYAVLVLIMAGMLGVFLLANNFLNWSSILNTPSDMAEELSTVALVVFTFFCLQFVLKLITTVLTANQEPAKASFFNLLGSLLSLAVIFTLTKTTEGNLVYLASALSMTPVLVLLASSFWFFNTSYRRFAPTLRLVNFKLVGDLLNLGMKFFIIQIGILVLFSTQNIIITQLFGPSEVTPYNIAYKLFSVVTMGFGIIVTPLWSAFTEAYVRKDFYWINKTLAEMRKIWVLTSLASFLILFASPYLYQFWVGEKVSIPYALSIAMSFHVIAYSFQTIYVFFLNGIGKIQMQLYLIIGCASINIPLTIYFGKLFGLVGITLTSTIIFLITGVVYLVQTRKILNNTATGIWME